MKSIRTALCGTLTAVAVCAAPTVAFALEAPSTPGQVAKHDHDDHGRDNGRDNGWGGHDRDDHGRDDHGRDHDGRDDDHGRDHDGRDDDHGRDDHGRDDHGRDHDNGWDNDHGRDDHGRDDHGRDDHGRDDHGRDHDHDRGHHDDHGRDHDHGRGHGDHDRRGHHDRPHGWSHAGGGATAKVAAAEESSFVDTPVLILAGATAGIAGGLIWSRRRAAHTVKR
ncbi:hypothetical protein I5Q34_22095 [Streptomyces sp. AV19]|uniref:hypothetical protein n=1 Tax=Streptomyces sp. AV19 TaxID=2793068 RepID=UPI0018FE8F93|nr:hypothetical protein [Streptomyces sp. AV19]MBH1936927.1 hypothetical protein [Streptomyces sp. AV19]MDG4532970.1 hypothetical protein [Streptomyces sp. AV19]